jgi:hypothetical protein
MFGLPRFSHAWPSALSYTGGAVADGQFRPLCQLFKLSNEHGTRVSYFAGFSVATIRPSSSQRFACKSRAGLSSRSVVDEITNCLDGALSFAFALIAMLRVALFIVPLDDFGECDHKGEVGSKNVRCAAANSLRSSVKDLCMPAI